MERFGAQGVTFTAPLVLTRSLDPSVYGIVTLVTAFATILQVFVDSGMGNALIQKKDVNNLDFSLFFCFNVVFCLVIYTSILGITLAYLRYGAWTLVAQHLFNLVVDTIILWINVKWRSKWIFSF